MKCSEINFVSSQYAYGILIAKQLELPALTNEAGWNDALERVAHLARMAALKQIRNNKRKAKHAAS